ncbi:MAG: hypothetical protein ACM3NQ_12710 [Bacteroidales bacterium]
MNLLPILIPVALIPIIVVVFLLARRARNQRKEAMQRTASTIGFAFEEKGDVEGLRARADLPLFGHGHTKRASNAMTGRLGDQEVIVFDYQYTTGGGKESHTWRQTVALFPRGGGRLPDFTLAPENVFHKIGQVFGYRDIDFESHPEFSTCYLLRGNDESAIRAAFPPAALSYLEQHRGWNVEVHDGTAAVYRSGKRVKPEDLASHLEDTRAILRVLVS